MPSDEQTYLHDMLRMITEGQSRLSDQQQRTNELVSQALTKLADHEARLTRHDSIRQSAVGTRQQTWLVVGSITTSIFTLLIVLVTLFGHH